MRALLPAIVLALALASLGVWWATSRQPGAPAGPARRVDTPPTIYVSSHRPAQDPAASALPRRDGVIDLSGFGEAPPPPSASDAHEPRSGDRGRALAGLVQPTGRGASLAGTALRIESLPDRELLARVTLDRDGRFVTDPLPIGSVLVVHDLPPASAEPGLWIEPGTLAILPGEGPVEQTFTARRPAWTLEVDVLEADGSPAEGATVHLRHLEHDPETGAPMHTGGSGVTDAQGRARLGLWRKEGLADARVFAIRGQGEASALLEIGDPTEAGIPRLVLGPASWLEVIASWSFGGPAALRALRVSGPGPSMGSGGFGWTAAPKTDAEGRSRVGPLLPGSYTVTVDNPRLGWFERVAADVELAPGETRRLEVTLGEGKRRMAASGRVVNERGEPLAGAPVAGASGLWPAETATGADGRFELWMEPCTDLTVSVDHDTDADVFEPGSMRVPFGTVNLRFQRTAIARIRRFRIAAVDATSGAPIDGAIPRFDRGPGHENWSNGYAPRDLYERRVPPGLRCHVGAPGYISETLDLHALLAASGDEIPTVEVRLRPGLSAAVHVLDVDTGEPLPGVLFQADGAPEVRADAEGVARLQSERWRTYRVSHPGYREEEWDPEDWTLFVSGPLLLERAD